MPTYDYQCQSCGHEFEVFQSISAEPLQRCPVCGSMVRRLIRGGSGLIFKGSGFYITDYKKNSGGQKKKESTNATVEHKD